MMVSIHMNQISNVTRSSKKWWQSHHRRFDTYENNFSTDKLLWVLLKQYRLRTLIFINWIRFATLICWRLLTLQTPDDFESMFCKVRMKNEDTYANRFLWRDNPKSNNEPSDHYNLLVHVFGLTDSPCAGPTTCYERWSQWVSIWSHRSNLKKLLCRWLAQFVS